MRMTSMIVVVTLCSFATFGQVRTAEDDPHWPEQIVKRAFSEVSAGMRTSWSERYLARLGDGAAPEIMKIVSAKSPTTENAQTALMLVKMSFADPPVIKHEQNKNPTNTLILLDYLDRHTGDADVKSKITSTRGQLKAQVSNQVPHKSR
jgi:hypothetical protein